MQPYIGPYSPEYYKNLIQTKKEKRAEYNRKYREENKERLAKQKKQYHDSNKSQIADYNSQYYRSHKDELNIKKRDKTTFRRQLKYRHEKLQNLKHNPHQHSGKRILHRIKTGQIDFSLNGPLSDEEIQSLDSIHLPPIPSPQRRKYQGAFIQKQYRDKKILRRQTDMLNNEFSRKDPNRFLPLRDILNYGNYSYDYLPQREIFKIQNHKRTSLYEQWEKEYNDYMAEVKKISNEDKIKFLNK